MRRNIMIGLMLAAITMPAFSTTPTKKTKKENKNFTVVELKRGVTTSSDNKSKDGDPTVVVIRNGVRSVIPFNKTNTVNPDSIESVSIHNDTLFIQLKSVRKTTVKRSTVKK